MDCDCNMPNCMACFVRYAEAVEKMGCADKELYYEWQDLITQEIADDMAWDQISPAELAKMLKNSNEW